MDTIDGRRRRSVGLTDAENRVGALAAEGFTNRDIAGRLGLAEHTVKVHMKSILAKAGFENRTQFAVWKKTGRMPQSAKKEG